MHIVHFPNFSFDLEDMLALRPHPEERTMLISTVLLHLESDQPNFEGLKRVEQK